MGKFKLNLVILGVILILGLLLRILWLNVSPPGFNADEAALGYNAYSLILTGKDEWGESFPIVFKSFSDYKPGLYVYLAIPFVFLMGLSELSVRMPSIVLGVLSILVVYLLSKKIFENEVISLSSAFLLAVSPWHIHYSRGAWETNIATFFILIGTYFFVLGLKANRWFLLSGIAFILSMYAYQSTRLVVPVFLLLLAMFYLKKVFSKKNIITFVLCGLFILPLVMIVFSNRGLARFQGVSIFTDIGPGVKVNQDRGEHQDPDEITAKIFHNKLQAYSLNFISNYFDHFSPDFLFTKGDPLGRNKVPEMGQLYLFEVLTLILGFIFLIKNRFQNTKVILFWLVVAPLAASITYQTPHALRSENMVIPLSIISGVGLGGLINLLKKQPRIISLSGQVVGVIVISFFVSKFLHQYFVHLPKQYALEWEYGFSQLVPYVMENKDKYDKILVTDKYDQAYILFLFYSKYDPKIYQLTAKPTGVDKFGFSTITSFDKFEFRPIGNEEVGRESRTLYIGTPLEMGEGKDFEKVIKYPNGDDVFRIFGSR